MAQMMNIVDQAKLDNSHRKFFLEVTARRTPSNEVEGPDWLAPDDFANFLRKRFTVKEDVPYGLDAYNKHSGQLILDVNVVQDTGLEEKLS
jgi:hypothetical protein